MRTSRFGSPVDPLERHGCCSVGSRIQASVIGISLALGASAAPARAGIPDLQLMLWIDGKLVYDQTPGGADVGNGTFSYVGNWTDIGGSGASLSWNLTGDPDPQVSGNLVVENPFLPDVDVVLQVILPINPPLNTATKMIGSAALTLTTDSGGGAVTDLGVPIWQGLLDGADVAGATLFPAAFDLTNPGFGSMGTNSNFGIPVPLPGPPVQDSIGIRISFNLTQHDQASITSVFNVTPTPGSVVLLGLGAVAARRRRRRRGVTGWASAGAWRAGQPPSSLGLCKGPKEQVKAPSFKIGA